MGYKQIDRNMTFAEVSLLKSMEHNRSLKRLEKIKQIMNWSKVDEILMSHSAPTLHHSALQSIAGTPLF